MAIVRGYEINRSAQFQIYFIAFRIAEQLAHFIKPVREYFYQLPLNNQSIGHIA